MHSINLILILRFLFSNNLKHFVSIKGSYLGMLVGIQVITLLELAFWFVRFIARRFFKPCESEMKKSIILPKVGKDRIDVIQLDKRVSAIEKRNSGLIKKRSIGAKLRGKIPKRGTWPTI